MTGINGRTTATQCLSAKCLSILCVPHPKDVSSELSIELSHYEEQPPSLSPLIQEDEESDEEDEEFPSFYLQTAKSEKLWNHSNFVEKKDFWLVTWRCWSYMDCFGLSEPPSISEGVFVWHKLRSYPFWPAVVGALLVMSCGVKSWLDHKISIIGKFCKQVSLFCNSAGEKCESQAEKSKRVVNWWPDTFQKQRVGNFLSFNSLNAQIVYVIAYQRNIASPEVLQSAHWPQH